MTFNEQLFADIFGSAIALAHAGNHEHAACAANLATEFATAHDIPLEAVIRIAATRAASYLTFPDELEHL